MADTVYASFSDLAMAEKAVGALMDHGIDSENISLVSSETSRTDYPVRSTDTTAGDSLQDTEDVAKTGFTTTTPGDAAAGARAIATLRFLGDAILTDVAGLRAALDRRY